uniref:Fzd-5/8-3 n=1 Tax=Dendrocoelum lacteum TaxID=27895 RepID=T1D138_9PLAT
MKLCRCLWITLTVLLLLSNHLESTESDFYPLKQNIIHTDKKCERIKIPMCKDIDYNMTIMPNMFNHETQDEAGFEAHQFFPLVQIQCSEDLRFFLCSIYTPICLQGYGKSLPPCRSVCERVKKGCNPLLRKYKFKWPEKMECSQFPVFDNPEKILCMEKNIISVATTTTNLMEEPIAQKDFIKIDKKTIARQHLSTELSFQLSKQLNDRVFCQCQCRKPLIEIFEINKAHFNRVSYVSTLGMPNCALGCKLAFFATESDQKFTNFWLGLWTTICLISTFSIVATFSIDPSRYRYPERPIIFISICYFMLSLGFVLRLSMGHEEIACDSITGYGGQSFSLLKYGSTGPAQCTIVFILIYYFGMAASLWWVLLTITWFLAAGLKWGSEAISKYSQIYHFIAWFIPGIKSIVALTMSAVDGDSITGICYIGNTSDFNLALFVLAPLMLYLLIGTLVLFSGFASLFRIRNIIKIQTGGKTEKLEKLMIKIGIFSVLYTAPATIIIACLIYELQHRSEWYQNLSCDCYDTHRRQLNLPQPIYAVFMLKYFMYMAVGITSGFWIWSKKTVRSWKIGCYRLGMTSCNIEERKKNTSLTNVELRHGALLRHNNMLSIDNGSSSSQHGGSKSVSGVTHCPYTHNHSNCTNIPGPNLLQNSCYMNQQCQNIHCRPIIACASTAPLPSPPRSSGNSTPPPHSIAGLCIPSYLQNLQDTQDTTYLPFISSHDTNPSCYFSSSGGMSIASNGIPLKPNHFSVAQL